MFGSRSSAPPTQIAMALAAYIRSPPELSGGTMAHLEVPKVKQQRGKESLFAWVVAMKQLTNSQIKWDDCVWSGSFLLSRGICFRCWLSMRAGTTWMTRPCLCQTLSKRGSSTSTTRVLAVARGETEGNTVNKACSTSLTATARDKC